MLSLSTQDVQIGAQLSDKPSVIAELANWLERDGLAAAGYGSAMLAREAQTATYLGQGIAIPHGTLDTRHLVLKTGIRAIHLPEGVDWGDGEKAYLVLGIAAGSDEHLDLLKQLARALSRDGLAEQVRAARQPQDILQLLQGEEAQIELSVSQLGARVAASSLSQLVEQACALMGADAAEQQALGNANHLGQGWWLSQVAASKEAKVALVTAATAFEHQQQPVQGLLTLASSGSSHKNILNQLADWLVEGQGTELASQASAEALLAALNKGPGKAAGGELQVQVCNPHGLHARPGAALVKVAKQFKADIQVRNLDGSGKPVSAKSLMKIMTLGVKVGHTLAFSATGEDADEALKGLVAAVESGLGEETVAVAAGPAASEAVSSTEATPGLAANERLVTIRNAHGLHARPGAMLVQTAKKFEAKIEMRNLDGDGHSVSAKSLMKVISLGVKAGHQLVFKAEGADAEQALSGLVEAVESGLGEDIGTLVAAPAVQPEAATDTPSQPEMHQVHDIGPNTELQGVPASPGTAIGPVFVEAAPVFDYPQKAADAAAEQAKLHAALKQADEDLAASVEAATQIQAKEIMAMHRELLDDPSLAEGAVERIKQGLSVQAAWWSEIDSAATLQAASPDTLLAERAADIRDIGRRVMAILCNTPLLEKPATPYIWVAEDIGPSDVVNMDPAKVLGMVTAGGGASSHSAILARSLGIPALVGMGGGVMTLAQDTQVILDGEAGTLWVAPEQDALEQAKVRQQQEKELAEKAWASRDQHATTLDQHRIEVCANLGDTAKAVEAVEAGAEGVGLLRTEFVFMAQSSAPDLAAQTAEYKKVIDALDGRPLVARTLDVGGDKPLPYWPVPKEENPFLGVRGIRLCMQKPELLETQLRALLTAAGKQPIRIMFPMVADWSEWRWAKEMFDRVQAEVQAPDVQLGIMIEVPSAALNAHVFAEEADFFSIGTNDLTQYTLAVDRGNGELSSLSDAMNPAVLRLIKMTVDAAHAKGKWVGVCGEMGSDPKALPILLGLGVDELSVSLKRVPLVKAQVREWSLSRCRELAEQALVAQDAGSVRALVGEAK
ncbi:phosphoenolpyruvate--protein phosphotransferase [Oceanisphaera psychrotolerans]|uniref:Multiphosphoryl transfer protein n=1 Tax=Oceanisphaera psychrotolerans TaxID=1414654 RepID=A0A1J4QGM0_9GAMM|nr:phosphoenolpyruvate--protein phosphotransferase [Oceanisphaera psychrotolerans]OIN12912.1 phosphoenolpyruvate-protein phosphotransferase [Oceanisphaera psychrotolerans]